MSRGWANLLYVQNLLGVPPWPCLGHTWFLAADVQLFAILTPLVILPMHRLKTGAWGIREGRNGGKYAKTSHKSQKIAFIFRYLLKFMITLTCCHQRPSEYGASPLPSPLLFLSPFPL